MLHFLHQGGVASYVILLLGSIGLLSALRRDEHAPLQLALATFMLGMGSSALNFYTVLTRWNDGAFGGESARVGFEESLTTLILASLLSTLIVVVDLSARAFLRRSAMPRGVPRP